MAIFNEINAFCATIPHKTKNAPISERIALDIHINTLARRVITTPMTDEQRNNALNQLKQAHTHIVRCDARDAKTNEVRYVNNNAVFFNLIQPGIDPALTSRAVDEMGVPTIAEYHALKRNRAIIRMQINEETLKYIPKEVDDLAGNLEGKDCDLFWVATDGRWLLNDQKNVVKLRLHAWTHLHEPLGVDKRVYPEMGMIPKCGFDLCITPGLKDDKDKVRDMQILEWDRTPKNSLQRREVYVHENRYSPNNTEISVTPHAPFGTLWCVAKLENRIVIAKMITLFDYDHPICKVLMNAIRDCNDLPTHIERLKVMEKVLKDPKIIEGMRPCFPGLSDEQIFNELNEFLYTSQIGLFVNAPSLTKGDNVIRMMECAKKFFEQPVDTKNDSFLQLSNQEQEACRFALWEIAGRPYDLGDLGKAVFEDQLPSLDLAYAHHLGEQSAKAYRIRKIAEDRGNAVLLAASRQKHVFEKSVEVVEVKDGKQEEVPLQNNNNNKDSKLEETQVITDEKANKQEEISLQNNNNNNKDGKLEETQVIAEIPLENKHNNESEQEVSQPVVNLNTVEGVLSVLMDKQYDPVFNALGEEQKKEELKKTLSHLPEKARDAIAGAVYGIVNLNKPDLIDRTDGKWGENHIADDITVLINAITDNL